MGNSLVSGEFPAQRPVTRSFDVFFDLCLNKRLSKQLWSWWFETPSSSLWRHCNEEMVVQMGWRWHRWNRCPFQINRLVCFQTRCFNYVLNHMFYMHDIELVYWYITNETFMHLLITPCACDMNFRVVQINIMIFPKQQEKIPYLDSKVHGANMDPPWGRQDPGRPHVDPMSLVIRVSLSNLGKLFQYHSVAQSYRCHTISQQQQQQQK